MFFSKFQWNDLSLTTLSNIQSLHTTLLNSKVSKNIHDQGETLFCWAFAISSMLRQSLNLFIDGLNSEKIIVSPKALVQAKSRLNKRRFHKQLRNELIMLPIPKVKNRWVEPIDQGHYLDLACQRV